MIIRQPFPSKPIAHVILCKRHPWRMMRGILLELDFIAFCRPATHQLRGKLAFFYLFLVYKRIAGVALTYFDLIPKSRVV